VSTGEGSGSDDLRTRAARNSRARQPMRIAERRDARRREHRQRVGVDAATRERQRRERSFQRVDVEDGRRLAAAGEQQRSRGRRRERRAHGIAMGLYRAQQFRVQTRQAAEQMHAARDFGDDSVGPGNARVRREGKRERCRFGERGFLGSEIALA